VPTCFSGETAAHRKQNHAISMTCRIGHSHIRPKYAQRPQTQVFRTVLRETCNSRQISLIVLPRTKNSRRTFAILSTPFIPLPPIQITGRAGLSVPAKGGQFWTPIPRSGGQHSTSIHSDEAQERGIVREDADFARYSFELLLDGAFDRVRDAHALAVVFWQGEDGEALGHGRLEPVGEQRCAVRVAGDRGLQLGLGGGKALGVPDLAQLAASTDPWALADRRCRGIMNGILCQMELATLPCGTTQHGFAGGRRDRRMW